MTTRLRRACAFLLERTRETPSAPAARLARDFLLALSSDPTGPRRSEALERIRRAGEHPAHAGAARLFEQGLEAAEREWTTLPLERGGYEGRLERLASALAEADPGSEALPEAFWGVFCPQAVGVRVGWEERLLALRAKRTVGGLSLNPKPVRRPARQILFTSNVLLTLPPPDADPAALGLPRELEGRLEQVAGEDQRYWYDHPVRIGTPPERNEILHGLTGLSEMLAFEKARGNAHPDDRLTVVLSVSVTHPGLKALARPYLENEIAKAEGIRSLDLYVFTEDETGRLIDEFLCPAAERFGLEGRRADLFAPVFGVDGTYARHYNFLKAVAALWQVVEDPGLEGTFKIDLDQVFPQEHLVREAGGSAFDLLCTPLWGARGRDADGRPLSLGMIAGALVNEQDIGRGLFTPDVTLPEGPLEPEQWIFASRIPQALSTAAEMMARYGPGPLDGRSRCLQRIHVTGGTVGIRVEDLRRHRPFTLSVIGRAEDQAYLMSVLFGPGEPCLRYAHVPGLIMRHDKHGLAADAIRAAAAGKTVGDYERMLLFSGYADALPWPREEIRSLLDPFTGCFIHDMPAATALLRLALKVLSLCGSSSGAERLHGEEILGVAARRLSPLLEDFARETDWIGRAYASEGRAWNAYYEILDRVEEEIRSGNPEGARLRAKARAVLASTRVVSG